MAARCFSGGDGRRGIVKSYPHGVADYVTAFVNAGFEVKACVERVWTEREVLMMNTARVAPEACIAAVVGVR